MVGLLAAGWCPVTPPAAAGVGTGDVGTASYVVHLVDEPVSSYRGGRPGLSATAVGPGRKLDVTSPAATRYVAALDAGRAAVRRAAAVPDRAVFYEYRYSFNGFAADLTAAQAALLSRDPRVRAVTRDDLQQPLTDNTPGFLGLDKPGGLWAQAGGQSGAGEDVIVGIIDTGIWPEHPSFSDQSDLADRPGRSGRGLRAYGPPPSYWRGTCQAGEQWSRDDCNAKLIGARFFLEGFRRSGIITADYESPRDANGHGSHTASTVAGNAGVDPTIFGRQLGVGTISGMAPRARIAAYKACWEDGCALTDLVAAIDAAVADGVDVVNYSIGTDQPALVRPDTVAFLFAADANVFVAASAGNAGPGAGTVGSPASAPWVTAVGASTHSRTFSGAVTLGNGTSYSGASVTPGLAERPLVDGEAAGSIGCEGGELDPAMVSGKIVLCEGSRLRAARGHAVAAAGGVGMVLYQVGSPMNGFSDNHYIPAVHLSREDGLAVKSYVKAQGAAARASITAGEATADTTAPSMTHFSSRGPDGAATDVIKPDVTAPGMQVLAANTPTALGSAPGQLFQAISGTSMSSPHVAGVAALLVQAHRDWTPATIRSALTTTAGQQVTKEDRVTPADPFDFGGGHIRPNPATDPGLVYESGLLDHVAFLCGSGELPTKVCTDPAPGGFGVQPIDPSDLNLASIGVDRLAGNQTVTRTVTNRGPASTYSVAVDAPAGVGVSVVPSVLTIPAGGTATFAVTFTVSPAAVTNAWHFGSLTWADGSGHAVRSPIAVRPVLLEGPESFTGTGRVGSTSWDVKFGYAGPFTADPLGLVPPATEDATVVDDPANEITVALDTGIGIREHVLEVPAGTVHLRVALFDEATDGGDDLDVYLYDPGGNEVAFSAGLTSAEQVDVVNPQAGTWKVVVHGWQTEGPDAAYTLFDWRVPSSASGNLTVTAPPTATPGTVATVDVAWTGLTAATRYLGAVRYGNGSSVIFRTLIQIDSGP